VLDAVKRNQRSPASRLRQNALVEQKALATVQRIEVADHMRANVLVVVIELRQCERVGLLA
jgi:hypothetical protein